MKIVSGAEVRDMLSARGRVYLCGDLQSPDIPSHIPTDGLEIGISRYAEFHADLPHYHKWNMEYNIVLRGAVKVFIFPEQKEYLLREQDMFLIEPHMGYVTKALSGTEVLFVKSPGGNDKVLLPVTPSIAGWQSSWDGEMEACHET